MLPGDEVSVECRYQAALPFVVAGGVGQGNEVCLVYLLYAPAGAFAKNLLRVPDREGVRVDEQTAAWLMQEEEASAATAAESGGNSSTG